MTTTPEKKKPSIAIIIAALGVVFGDIGTSPLYAFDTALESIAPGNNSEVIALASLIVWALILVVTIKYVMFVMRADFNGEGGIFALYGLAKKAKFPHWIWKPLSLILVIGAALLYGDGTITPAISVLSAVEGLEAVKPSLTHLVIPITVVILTSLFAVQRFGTGKLGGYFGYVMLIWFVSIGVIGLWQVLQTPEVLEALLPWKGLGFIGRHLDLALIVLGAVVLAVTGAEALYADLGHFGRSAISSAWHFIALPGLLLNYLGQAALVIRVPGLHSDPNLFYQLYPAGGIRIAMIILATITTVIASQALISGIFSLTNQAIALNYLPRFAVFHTSSDEKGQIYMPAINWILGAICLFLVVTFRSSDSLAGAYGLAVTGTMICTTIGYGFVLYCEKKWKIPGILLICGVFLIVEVTFLAACAPKFVAGGYVPVILGIGMIAIFTTWKRGRRLIREEISACGITPEEFGKSLSDKSIPRVPGTLVILGRRPDAIVAAAVAKEYLRRTGAIHEQVVFLSLSVSWSNPRSETRTIHVKEYENGVSQVISSFGFMMFPNAPLFMTKANEETGGRIMPDADKTFYVLFREAIYEQSGSRMPAWRRNLFTWLSRNVQPGLNYLSVPPQQIVEFNWMMHF